MKFKTKYKKIIIGMLCLILTFLLLPIKSFFAVQEIKDNTDLAHLDTYKFNLNVNNMEVISKSNAVNQARLNNPYYQSLSGQIYHKPMENFTLKVDKTNKSTQVFEQPLKLKFSNVGEVYGKKVDAYLTINRVTVHYNNTTLGEASLKDSTKKNVQFFNVSEIWENGAFELGNIPYVDAAHNDIIDHAYWIDADVTAELKYSDGSNTDLKLVMVPSDVDVTVDGTESFYIKNYTSQVDKTVMNTANALKKEVSGDKTIWRATKGTDGDASYNVGGLAVRSVNNSLEFGYQSTAYCSAVFGLFVEGKIPAPVKTVDPTQAPAKKGQKITYTGTFKVPTPGKDVIGSLDSLDLIDTFDERLTYQDLKVEADGKVLTEHTDYTVTVSGQTVTVKMAEKYLQRASGADTIKVTYNTVTNEKVEQKTSGVIENTVTLKVDNVLVPSNKVKTTLLYNKTHEFQSGTPGMSLPKEVTDLTPPKVSKIPNGTTVTPDQPKQTEVTVPEGTWVFKGYTEKEKTVDGADVHFIGIWVLKAYKKISIEKKWIGPAAESATFNILVDGKVVNDADHTVTLDKTTGWSYTFDKLLKYSLEDGHEYKYSLAEVKVNNYDSKITGDVDKGFIVTNTNTEKVTVKVNKKWNGPEKNSVIVKLVIDGKESEKKVELTAATNWSGEFTDLPKYNADGGKIHYTVKEVPVEDFKSEIAGDANTGFTITNTYIPADPIQVPLVAEKVLEGKPLEANKYQFKLFKVTNGTEQEVETVTNKQDGSITFTPLTFNEDEVGEHDYVVREVIPADNEKEAGVTYDKTEFKVKIKVEKAFGRKLTATITRSPEALVFKNKYTAKPVNVPLSVTKKLTGRELKAGEFEFVLKDKAGKTVETVKNTADGQVNFRALEFTKTGTYVYTISETKGNLGGISYDTHQVTATIEVTDDGSGQLKAKTSYKDNNQTFNNTYTTKKTSASLEVTKALLGRTLKADEFEFVLKNDEDGSEVQKVKNTADGKVVFAPIEYTKAGTYKYTIVETNAGQTIDGVTYDSLGVKVIVEVTDDGEGNLTANVTYPADKEFNNSYGASKTSATLAVKKTLTGRELKADEFEFTLTDQDGNVKETVKNDKDGNVKFSALEFDKAGTFTYKIAEKTGTATGITYDTKTITATVTVADNGKGALEATVTYDDEKAFENTYTPAGATSVTLGAKKVLEGKDLEAGKYSFVLKEGDKELETVTNAADGTVAFSPISYDESQVGTHKYTISEVAGTETGITYDKTVQEVEVTVEKVSATELKATASKEANDLVFTNKYTPAGATSVTLGAKKVLEGKNLEAGKYSFELKKEDGTVVETVTNAADGTVTFSPISYDESQVGTHKYTISEVAGTETGITYDKTVQEVEVTVEKVSATELKATASKEAKDLVFTNKYTPAKTQVSVKKAWDDKDNQDGKRPTSVTVKLLADGQDTGKTLELNAANGWAGSFTDLDADKGGTPIQYTVVEVTVPGYTSKVTGDAASGFTITNSYSPETVDIKATKNWDDANNQDGKRPTKITINLLADGQKVDSKEVQAAADGTWTVEFTKLAKYKDGKEIKYTITEEAVAEYESTITDFTITNKYAPKAIDYKVTKVWNDANNQDGKRPESVTVQLYKKVGDADPVAVEGKKLTLTAKDKTDANTWVASFTNIPQYEAGKEITYSIKEVDVPAGYEASVTGQVVTNTHNPDTVILSGTKVWKDNNNQDGKRTTSVKVQILKNDKEVVQEIEVSEKTGWKFESKKLPKYENGQEIKYTVKEVAVASYETTITPEKDGKYTITNEHTPEKITVKGKKIWDDANNKDGIRPDSITVALLANGKETGKTVTVTKATALSDNEWAFEFTDLDRYANGKPIEYTVKEVGTVNGYTAKEDGMNVTNIHTPEKPTPGKPNEPGKPGPKPQLPNTGEKASNAAVVAGLALIAVTGGLYFVSRKNK